MAWQDEVKVGDRLYVNADNIITNGSFKDRLRALSEKERYIIVTEIRSLFRNDNKEIIFSFDANSKAGKILKKEGFNSMWWDRFYRVNRVKRTGRVY